MKPTPPRPVSPASSLRLHLPGGGTAERRSREDRPHELTTSWSNNDLVANNSGSTGLLSTAENIVKKVVWPPGCALPPQLFSQ